jgi:MraZ protein
LGITLKTGDKCITLMLIGEYKHTIDSKKRLAIPAKFREALGGKAVITRGLENCLVVYTLKEWEKMAKKIEELPTARADARDYARMIFSGACDVELDKLGRILIPDYLKNYASLKKNVTLIGMSNKIEVWDETQWQEHRKKIEDGAGDNAEGLKELGV